MNLIFVGWCIALGVYSALLGEFLIAGLDLAAACYWLEVHARKKGGDNGTQD